MEKRLPQKGFEIIKGPSKFDLMCSIFDGKVVELQCNINSESVILKAVFTSIKLSDGDIYEEKLSDNASEEKFYISWMGEVTFIKGEYEYDRRDYYYSTRSFLGFVCDKASKSSV